MQVWMKRAFSLLAALMLLASLPVCSLAEEDDEEIGLAVTAADTAPVVKSLPMDFSAGKKPDPAAFTEEGYSDESITVRMERVWQDGVMFNVAYVKIADPSQLRIGLASGEKFGKRTNKVSAIAAENNAVVAIGGDYFLGYSGEWGGYIVRMQQTYLTKPKTNRDMMLTDTNGNMHILPHGKDLAARLQAVMESCNVVNVFNFGPAMIIDGELQKMPDPYKFNITGWEPRCALGQTGELEYMLVVVDGGKGREVPVTLADGTQERSHGCTVETLAQFMFDRGCTQAYNLDGGNSALMYFGGENYSSKSVNAERSVSDIIYFATTVGE